MEAEKQNLIDRINKMDEKTFHQEITGIIDSLNKFYQKKKDDNDTSYYNVINNIDKIRNRIININYNTSKSEIINIWSSIRNIYNMHTFDTIFNTHNFSKLKRYSVKQTKDLEKRNVDATMVEYNDDTSLRKIELNYFEYNKIKQTIKSLKIIFLMVGCLIIVPIIVQIGLFPKYPGVLLWGLCLVIIAIVSYFILFIKNKNKPQFCAKDDEGFEKCTDVEYDTRHYYHKKFIDNHIKKDKYSYKDIKKMSDKERQQCDRWERVKSEFGFEPTATRYVFDIKDEPKKEEKCKLDLIPLKDTNIPDNSCDCYKCDSGCMCPGEKFSDGRESSGNTCTGCTGGEGNYVKWLKDNCS
jgi:hypothetical protein